MPSPLGGVVEVPCKPKPLAGDTPVKGTNDGIDPSVACADDCRADSTAAGGRRPGGRRRPGAVGRA